MLAQKAGDRKSREARDEGLALPENVSAAFDGANGGSVGRRPADTQPLEFLDERSFSVPRGGRRFVTLRFESQERHIGSGRRT